MISDFKNIVCTSDTLWGSPRIDGRRLAVGDVVSIMNNYGTLQQIINDYELTISEIRQALQYCSVLQCKQDKPAVFCHNCSLRGDQDGSMDTSNLEEMILEGQSMVKGEKFVFFGTMNELLAEWKGRDWWIIATDLLIDYRNDLFEKQSRS